MKLEELQEANLHNNWSTRKDLVTYLASQDGYDVYDWRGEDGRRCFYIVRENTPVGYVYGYTADNLIQINSTYITPIARRRGLGTLAYKTMMSVCEMVVSDFELSPGAKALWERLIRDETLNVRYNGYDRYLGSSL